MKKILFFLFVFSFFACQEESKPSFDLFFSYKSDITYTENELVCYLGSNEENVFHIYELEVADTMIRGRAIGFNEFEIPNGFFIARFRNDTSMREVRFGDFMNNQILKNFYLIRLTKDSIIVETGYNAWPDYEE